MPTPKVTLLLLTVIAIALLCLALDVSAQPPPGDLPEAARHEIARRGNHVEMTGTIRSGLMAAALSPPADDSCKWFLTLVLKPGDPASEKMRQVLASDPALKPWVNVSEPLQSALHYHVRSIDDATQRDWLAGLKPAIARSGLPLLVLQPPKNGQFGDSSNIAKLVAGVVTGEQLAAKLREGIIVYVQTIQEGDLRSDVSTGSGDPRRTSAGHTQQVAGVPPPFSVPPNPKPDVPFDWPPGPVAPSRDPPPNPTLPVTGFPGSWLAILSLGTFITGWISARLKTLAGRKIADLTIAFRILQQTSGGPKDPTG